MNEKPILKMRQKLLNWIKYDEWEWVNDGRETAIPISIPIYRNDALNVRRNITFIHYLLSIDLINDFPQKSWYDNENNKKKWAESYSVLFFYSFIFYGWLGQNDQQNVETYYF